MAQAFCDWCPRACAIDRQAGAHGFCGAGSMARVSRCDLHHWEEPCISGKNGSGAVFFAHCSLQCAFCQNHCISQAGLGQNVTDEQLADLFLSLQQKGAHNLNLVTPTHFLGPVSHALTLAKAKGLILPVVYNCGGYERVETVEKLADLVSVWMPDCKFADAAFAKQVAAAPDYFEVAKKAITKMVQTAGKPVFDDQGLMQKGVLIRHLPLPGRLFDSKKIIDFVADFGNTVWFSLMHQYTPQPTCAIPSLNRPLPSGHYDALVEYCLQKGMQQVFVQEAAAADAAYIPAFSDCVIAQEACASTTK